jgi:(4-O-methyl)-D-glucuronate---lignin esterase
LRRRLIVLTLAASLSVFSAIVVRSAQAQTDPLLGGFVSPPESAKPRVWWHWMNGNITPEGIRLDLEWMQRSGLGGFQVFDAALQTPQVVDKRLAYMTPEWQAAFRYAIARGSELGLEEAIAGSPGWSESGGPWVAPSEGMKKYVWSTTQIEGGRHVTTRLASPPTITGAFQDLPINDLLPAPEGIAPMLSYYADSLVIAYRRPVAEIDIPSLHPKLSASGGTPDYGLLMDGKFARTTDLPIPTEEGAGAWIQYQFPKPVTIRAVTISLREPTTIESLVSGQTRPHKSVEISDDGVNFREIATVSGGVSAPAYTLSFAPVAARYFRIVLKQPPSRPVPDWVTSSDFAHLLNVKVPPPATQFKLSEVVLHAGPRVNRWEEKAAFVPESDLYEMASPPVSAEQVISKADVVNLTSQMKPDGTLDWQAPAGHWVVLRFGYSLLGVVNHPATAEATGLEVDKLDRRLVKKYYATYLDSYAQAVGPELMGGNGVRYIVSDSWEAGSQNWTEDMLAQFGQRRGYDPVPWLPVLAGLVVESAAASDRFLWDFRRTIAELIAEEHYGQLAASLRERHLGHYGESHEAGRAFVGDGMEVKKYNDIPMSAMWTGALGRPADLPGFNADDRESASVAHIYGQNLAAAESLTADESPWAWSPATLKPTADQEFLNGINRIVVHESAHQPLIDKAPGMTLGPFGQWFNRNETWAEQASAWVSYLARTSYMLQQGRYAADVVYFYGEDSNLTALFANRAPDVPAGYSFDYINADALIHELRVRNAAITTRSGMSYRILALDPHSQHMSLPVLRAIGNLVHEGAVVVGLKPNDDPSLADDEAEFRALADEIFGDGTGVHAVGKGRVYAGQALGDVLRSLRVAADFEYTKPQADTELRFVHRSLPGAEVYFVDNRRDRYEDLQATFRVEGKAPELWRAETGLSEPAAFSSAGGRTTVPLHLEPWGAVFVVFRSPTNSASRTVPDKVVATLAQIEGSWKVDFQEGRGAPESLILQRLDSWTQCPDAGVKYFSGAGTYTKTFIAQRSWPKKSAKILLDLGEVKNLAEVSLNGKRLGVVWHAPYRVDITGAVKSGTNELSIKVVNSWVNRLIGDQQPGATSVAFADVKPYRADSPLLESGLLGPVRIIREESK